MTKSTALLGSVALLSLVAASGGCGSSSAGRSPTDGTGAYLGVVANDAGAMSSTGAGGTGASPADTATEGSGGDRASVGGSTAQSGSGTGAAAAGSVSSGGNVQAGGSITFDAVGGQPSSGGQGTSIDVTGGQGTTIDVTGGQGTTIDLTGGQGTTIDLTGGQGTTVDLTGGRGTTVDHFGGTGNTSDATGGMGVPPPPRDSGTPPPGCIPTWFAKQINVLVLHDAYMGGADARGGLWVGGNLSGPSGYDIGADLPADPTCSRYDLAVGGNITLGGWLGMHNAGAYGGTLTASGVSSTTCGMFHNPADMPNFAQIAADVKSNSAYFAGLTPNGTVSGTTLNGANASCKIVVFNTTLCTIDWNMVISIPAGGTAIINSTCTNPSFSGGVPRVIMGGVTQPTCDGQHGTGGACEHILYNFPNATTVAVVNQGVQGSILAPYAKFIGQGGNVAGEVVVDSMDNTNGVEFHAWFFEGCLDTTTC
jgi:choice-of-anchor A domain-containing protein